MFASVLIANRGEIACRIARTAKALGMRTIAVYSDADAGALHVRLCDEAHRIGPAPVRESYLVAERIIEVGRRSGAACVHPGYGFLAENAEFAEAVATADMVFVGPPPAAIRAMGLKDAAKTLMEKAGVPVVPGYHGERQDPKFLKEKAYEIGYPVLIKAVAGGGGKGMRRVDRHADFETALEGASREATSAFGDGRVLVEKYITSPRHIEMQVFADGHGNAVHLYERDCSLQRRHQKVIEEAPAPGMTREVREAMGRAATEAAKAVGYSGAGTVEFIADGSKGLRPDGFWFMEMNTRLQVEHPVTEAITGLDLVEWQFKVAHGEPLPLAQNAIPLNGHAVEARLYAEDPDRNFMPSTGKLLALELPQGKGIRVDTGVTQGSEVSPFYDPMIAKVIAHAPSRDDALANLATALEHTVVAGPRSNVSFLAALCRAEEFRAGHFDTGFIDRNLQALTKGGHVVDHAAAAAGATRLARRGQEMLAARTKGADAAGTSPWDVNDAFGFGAPRSVPMPILVDGERLTARIVYNHDGLSATIDGHPAATEARFVDDGDDAVYVLTGGHQTRVQLADHAVDADHGSSDGAVRAPMHGKLLALFVEKGAPVTKGHRVAVIEAMKMEHTLTAPHDGTVAEVSAAVGEQLAEGSPIVLIEQTE
ncbi:MAG: acetyl/propionyl/methylcrotonyl-CoA carboxylase subunit alpha [Rhizobiales bacterium]|nr:acetyl/propionyl/methylcrotonyl-CoA carboxylase subunit alpha [Hyphomicrobiales bacterium]